MTDKERFKTLFDKIGIEYEEDSDLLIIDKFYIDGNSDDTELILSFYEDDSFQEFRIYD